MSSALITVERLSRSFGLTLAVNDVSLEIFPGSVHAFVGENGAGKSTLGKIIAGVIAPSSGAVRLATDESGHGHGRHQPTSIAMIDQELAIVRDASVADNVFLGRNPSARGFFKRKAERKACLDLIARSGFELDPDAIAGALSPGLQQQVEILRAISRDAQVIVMDEPTARLSHLEAERLHAIVRRLRDEGRTVIYVSHLLEEVLELADTITIMRDGEVVRTGPASEETVERLVEGMLGRSLESTLPRRQPVQESAAPLLVVENLTRRGEFVDVSFSVHPGEIVGFAGLVGSGRTELARTIVGLARPDSGCLRIAGREVRFRSPRAAMRAGIVMLPESRKDDGLVLSGSVAKNITLATLSADSRMGFVSRSASSSRVQQIMAELNVQPARPDMTVGTLSGGNQQKVVFARLVLVKPQVLIADEPTRGIDVGAKRRIYELLAELAGEGMGVIMISSELEEVLGLADRVVVMRQGRIVRDVAGESASKSEVLSAMLGAEKAAAA